MANNKSLQILRGSSSAILQSTDRLLVGQPLFDYSNNLLYVGTNSTTLKIKEHTPVYATGIKLKDGAKSLTLSTSTNSLILTQGTDSFTYTLPQQTSTLASEAYVTTQLSNQINALDYSDSTSTGQFVTKVSQTDGKISVTRSSLTTADIPKLGIDKIDDLQATLEAKAAITYVNDKIAAESTARNSADNDLSGRIDTLEASLAKLTYTPIRFTSFKHNGNDTTKVYLMQGSSYAGGALTWAFNSTPATLTINESNTNVNTTSYTLSSSTVNTTTTITATHDDEYDNTSSTSISFSVNFDWGVYLGVSAKSSLNSSDINTFRWFYTKPTSTTFNMNAQYAYVVSTSSGLTFKNNGSTVDFNKTTISHTNKSYATTTFYVYRTNNLQGSASSTASVTYEIS